ncbi:gamma-glutamylcyclotransferase [Parastagonospora nodorum]|nr:gamma-glutamylcyclotransferase [Parastagonospora nodorum]KAH4016756.1 gamma-glutamylcyclotransferase [Parastagonospora nodorum]KAH4402414.1 gamma-glutamylcyclotransferase [Parastagonospora nodorum]KAH4413853.1 gamma-glutamylcyclotransferase [Parastagonospora nodorum]KAH4432199.1 gamma-glutamylcyclotransferase [Parastagonospora nodorum]
MASVTHDAVSSQDSSYGRFYFTYGSNMHLQQMAQRCEESILYSKGRLKGYKWQINSRGGANIVRGNDADFVEGLIFIVSSRDLDSLRKYEKISEGYFVEKEIDINIEKLSILAFERQKTTRIAEEIAMYRAEVGAGGPLGSWQARLKNEKRTKKNTFENSVARNVLVYVVPEYCEDGKIRKEYIGRMESAIIDAEVLGVSEQYIKTSLHPCMF